MNVALTEKYLRALTLNIDNLRRAAAQFVNGEIKKNATKARGHTASDEEISFDHFQQKVIWCYEYNDACNCHPEYQKEYVEYSFADFVKWGVENHVEIEQFSETEIDL